MQTNKNYTHSWIGIGLLLCLFLVMMALMRFTAADVAKLSQGHEIIDLDFMITPAKVGRALEGYSASGAKYYRWVFLWIDFIYALTYCSFYRCTIRTLTQRLDAGSKVSTVLPMIPIAAMAADVLENNVMFILLGHSNGAKVLCVLFAVFNLIKFVLVYASLAIVIGGLLCLIKKRLS